MKLPQSCALMLSFIALVTLLASCGGKNQDLTSNEIAFDTISINKVYHLENDSTKPSCSLKVKYIVPIKYADTLILGKIQSELNTSFFGDAIYSPIRPKDAVDKYISDYIEAYKNDAQTLFSNWDESDESDDYFSYYKTLESDITYNKSDILSYQIKSIEYKGGANAYTGYKNIVIDLKTGLPVNEDNLFVSGYKGTLDEMLLLKLMQQNKAKSKDDLFELGYSRIEDFTSNNNFLVDDKGITYIFSQGEYSIPTLGEIKIQIPYEELSLILKENSPISKLTGK